MDTVCWFCSSREPCLIHFKWFLISTFYLLLFSCIYIFQLEPKEEDQESNIKWLMRSWISDLNYLTATSAHGFPTPSQQVSNIKLLILAHQITAGLGASSPIEAGQGDNSFLSKPPLQNAYLRPLAHLWLIRWNACHVWNNALYVLGWTLIYI